jgi:hypothetical protein
MTKYIVPVFVFFAFTFFALTACRAIAFWGEKVSYSIWKPKIVCENAIHNFGSITNSSPSYEFVILNKGSRNLLIHNVVAGCGACVEVESFTKTPISPNNSGSIKLKLLTNLLAGKVSKDVLVRTNDPKNSNFILTLEADIAENQDEPKDEIISDTKNVVNGLAK